MRRRVVLDVVTSEDGTRCSADCPQLPPSRDSLIWACTLDPYNGVRMSVQPPKRHTNCVARDTRTVFPEQLELPFF